MSTVGPTMQRPSATRRFSAISRARMVPIAAALALQWPLFPLSFAVADAELPSQEIVRSWCVFSFATVVLVAMLLLTARRWIATLVALATSAYATFCVALAGLRLFSGRELDFTLLIAIPRDTLESALLLIGLRTLAIVTLAVLVHTAILAKATFLIARTLTEQPRPIVKNGFALVALIASGVFFGAPHEQLIMEIEHVADIPPLAGPPALIGRGRESVFLVQLESLNAIAVNGEYAGHHRDGIPVMRGLAAEGVFFPHIWSHDVQTHRAQQAFLCGVVRNLQTDTVFKTTEDPPPCLPALLRDQGYSTVFLKGYPNDSFAEAAAYTVIMGYTDRRFGDLMRPGDPLELWGYAERTFFVRAMEYVERTYRPSDPLFVHLAVSAHHVGFGRTGNPDFEWFEKSLDERVGDYVRSAIIQDESIDTIVDRIRRFTNDSAHIFVFGDHSYPVGLYGSIQPYLGATVDNFVTSMLYLPPARRRHEFRLGVVDEVYALSDLVPTIAELVGGESQQNSLVPFMRDTPTADARYEQCHVMVQPFARQEVVIARQDTTVAYDFSSHCIKTYKLTHAPMRQELVDRRCGVSFEEYETAYQCGRFRRLTARSELLRWLLFHR